MKASLFRVVTLLTVMIILVSIPGGVFVKAQEPTGTGGVLADGSVPQVNGPQGGGPVPGGPGHVILNVFDFIPYEQSEGYLYGGTLLTYPGIHSMAYYLAPVHLPQGATINQVVAYYLDNDSGVGKNIEVDLILCNDFSTLAGVMASMTSSGALPSITYSVTTTILSPVVDNASYSYAVQVGLPNSPDVALNTVRIDYGYPTFLPTVRK